MKKNEKFAIPSEVMWVLAMLLMPMAITLCTKANLGMSMIAAPTYIVSEKTVLSYGQAEYIFQAIVLGVMCLLSGRFKWSYLTSFLTALIYGTILDFYIWLMRDVEVTALWGRILLLVAGMILTSFAVACFMHTYLAPCAYDYLVREVVEVRGFDLRKFKLANDFTYLILSVALTLILYRGFVGVYWGTLLMAVCNGHIIAFFSKQMDKRFTIKPKFEKINKVLS